MYTHSPLAAALANNEYTLHAVLLVGTKTRVLGILFLCLEPNFASRSPRSFYNRNIVTIQTTTNISAHRKAFYLASREKDVGSIKSGDWLV